MSNSDEAIQKTQAVRTADLPHRKSEGFAAVYTNTAGLGANFYDVQLIFGRVLQAYKTDEPGPYIEDVVSVSMSWEHAKALAASLVKALEDYEKDNGPIRIVPKP